MVQGNILVKILRIVNMQMNYRMAIPEVGSIAGSAEEMLQKSKGLFIYLLSSKINEYHLRSGQVS